MIEPNNYYKQPLQGYELVDIDHAQLLAGSNNGVRSAVGKSTHILPLFNPEVPAKRERERLIHTHNYLRDQAPDCTLRNTEWNKE